MDTQFNSLMSLGHQTVELYVPGDTQLFCSLSLAAKDPVGSVSFTVSRSWHGRPYYVSRPGAMCPRTEGAGRGRPLEAAGWATLWRSPQLRSACPSRGDTHHPASPWPHRLTSSTSARTATAPKALPLRSSFC